MDAEAKSFLGSFLVQVAKSLDIPYELYRAAVQEYEQLGDYLEECDRLAGRRTPAVYPQGSFALGVVTRPITEKDEYDVDLVYERDLQKNSTTKERLKGEAGENLEGYVQHRRQTYQDVPKLAEGSRCWSLEFENQFHMDILPAIPDAETRGVQCHKPSTAILITDKSLSDWQSSNPREFADWFRVQMEVRAEELRRGLAEQKLRNEGMVINEGTIKQAAEEIPEYEIKTPLQRAIQVLKRHRDLKYQDDPDNRPASILITTLAAKAYDNEANLVDALINLVRDMPKYIEDRDVNGVRVAWVENPVNDKENFADRWQDERYPDREKCFRSWLSQVGEELELALKGGGIHKVIDLLSISLGRQVVNESAKFLGYGVQDASITGKLSVTNLTGSLTTGAASTPRSTPIRGHTFYGDTENNK